MTVCLQFTVIYCMTFFYIVKYLYKEMVTTTFRAGFSMKNLNLFHTSHMDYIPPQ